MSFPKTADELTKALAENTLPHEAASVEYKQRPPDKAKNVEVAVDVAAMSTDGGVIIYGVAEDRVAQTFSPKPFDIVGLKERISQIVDTQIKEHVEFYVHELKVDGSDPVEGFAVVEVPASLRAPHQVETKGQFYGRHAGGNRVLAESEIAQLYERRQAAEDKARRSLKEAMALAPLKPSAGRGDLHVVVVPLVSDSRLRERAIDGVQFPPLSQYVTGASNTLRFKDPSAPQFMDLVVGATPLDTVDGMANVVVFEDEDRFAHSRRIELCDDGTLRYFHSGLTVEDERTGRILFRDNAACHLTAQACFMAGQILERGDYRGAVEVVVAVTGAAGAYSGKWWDGYPLVPVAGTIQQGEYTDYTRVTASRLVEEPIEVARSLLHRLMRSIRPGGLPDPFELL